MAFIKVVIFIVITVCCVQNGIISCCATDVINFGFVANEKGDPARHFVPLIRAVEMAVRKSNEQGGIIGKRVKLIRVDDRFKPDIAKKVAKELVSKNAHIVFGHNTSRTTDVVLGIYRRAKVIVFSASATSPHFRDKNNSHFYRTIELEDAEAKFEVNLTTNKLGKKRIAVLHDRSDYGKNKTKLVNDFLKKKRGVKVVLHKGIKSGSTNYSKIVKTIKKLNAEGLIFGGYYSDASRLIKEMNKQSLKSAFISGIGVKDDKFLTSTADYGGGIYIIGKKEYKNPLAVSLKKQYKKQYGIDPGLFFLNAYAATQIMLESVKIAGSTKYDSIKKVLDSRIFETPLGMIRFDEYGDAIGIGFSVYQVRKGKFIELS